MKFYDIYFHSDSFYFKPKVARIKELEDYQFECECDACTNDFPQVMTGEIRSVDKVLHSAADKIYNELKDPRKQLTPETARELAVKYSRILQQNYRQEVYPCREIILLQLCIIKCFLVASRSKILFP